MKIDGLEQSVASAPVRKSHGPLVSALAQHEEVRRAKFLISKNHYSEREVKVIAADGAPVSNDPHQFLNDLVGRVGGDVQRAWRDAMSQGYLVVEVKADRLVFTHDRFDALDGIVHVFVTYTHTPRARLLFGKDPWRAPRTLDDLTSRDLRGDYVEAARIDVPDRYELDRVDDLGAFMVEADQVNGATMRANAARGLRITNSQTGSVRESTFLAEHPELFKFPWGGRRFFDDWARSSAGMDGRRISDHWFFETSDWNDRRMPRQVGITPQWGFRGLIAKVEAKGATPYGIYDKLLKLDERVGVPFGWFFFMVHGNRVTQEAAQAVITAAEDGKIVLQERDYRVLKDWETAPYAF